MTYPPVFVIIFKPFLEESKIHNEKDREIKTCCPEENHKEGKEEDVRRDLTKVVH